MNQVIPKIRRSRAVLTVFLKEVKENLRDRRTLISTIVIPTVVMPGMMFGMLRIGSKIEAANRQETPTVMVIGGEDSPGVLAALRQSPKFRIVPTTADYEQRIVDKKLRAAVGIPAGFEARLAQHDAELSLPYMLRRYRAAGIDPLAEKILTYPVLHYQNGGLVIDRDAETTLAGVFACGEIAGGTHGRNRMMGNSLLECVVFGRRAGKAAAEKARA